MDFDYNAGGTYSNAYYPPLRSLSSAIRKQQSTFDSTYVVYEPGNATRYEIIFTTYSDGFGRKHNINLVNFRKSMMFVDRMGMSSIGYIQEKLDVNDGDAYALIPLINDYLEGIGS